MGCRYPEHAKGAFGGGLCAAGVPYYNGFGGVCMDGGFPVYILDDGLVLFSNEGVGHVEFWEDEVAGEVARRFGVPLDLLPNLPYCQRRGRVVGGVFYCGEYLSRVELRSVERAVGRRLRLIYDDHEVRCEVSVGEFRALLPAG